MYFDIRKKWIDGLANPLAPVVVSNPPCQGEVMDGPDVDLQKLPVPVWGEDDGGPFITSGNVITQPRSSALHPTFCGNISLTHKSVHAHTSPVKKQCLIKKMLNEPRI